jgi:hypothetical protein
MKKNFDAAMDEIKIDIDWNDGQSLEEWKEEPLVQYKLIRDIRKKALENIRQIKLDGLVDTELEESRKELEKLEKEVRNNGIELNDLINSNKNIEEIKTRVELKIKNNVDKAAEIGSAHAQATRNTTSMTIGNKTTSSDFPRPAALSKVKSNEGTNDNSR